MQPKQPVQPGCPEQPVQPAQHAQPFHTKQLVEKRKGKKGRKILSSKIIFLYVTLPAKGVDIYINSEARLGIGLKGVRNGLV